MLKQSFVLGKREHFCSDAVGSLRILPIAPFLVSHPIFVVANTSWKSNTSSETETASPNSYGNVRTSNTSLLSV